MVNVFFLHKVYGEDTSSIVVLFSFSVVIKNRQEDKRQTIIEGGS